LNERAIAILSKMRSPIFNPCQCFFGVLGILA